VREDGLKDDVKMCFWNIHGLASKLQAATAFFLYLNSFDIFCLAETWIKIDFDTFCFSSRLTNFDLNWTFATQRVVHGRAMGGMLIGVRKTLKHKWVFDSYNSIAFVRNLENGVIVIPAYIPPFNWEEGFSDYMNFFLHFDLNNFIFLGDLNARIGQLDNVIADIDCFGGRKSKDFFVNRNGHQVIDFCNDNNLVILNGRCFQDLDGDFTFLNANGQSVIDYVLVSRCIFDSICFFKIDFRLESDHFPLRVSLKGSARSAVAPGLQPLVPRLNWLLQDEQVFCERVSQGLSGIVFEELTVDESVDTVLRVIDQSAEKKKVNGFYEQRWFDIECLHARRVLRRSLADFKKISSKENHSRVIMHKKSYFELCRRKRRKYQDAIVDQFDNIKDSIDFWDAVKVLKKTDNVFAESITAVEWQTYFCKLLNPEIQYHDFLLGTRYVYDDDLDREFQLFEIKNALAKLKDRKAPGVDAIPSEFFKHLNEETLVLVIGILNRVFKGEMFPTTFTEAIVFPLFKKGDIALISNFRGISFLTAFYKIYTQMILARLEIFVFKKEFLHEGQAGFRKGYSTFDNIFTLSSIVEDNIAVPKGKVYAFFIDFSAAFDTVNRSALLYKLECIGISTKCCEAIKDIYTLTKAKVWTKGGYTDTFETRAGVRQGCILSPLLFTLYVNDLCDEVSVGGFLYAGVWIRMLMYADDIVFLSSDPDILQQMIDQLSEYCLKWDLLVNLKKSKVMVFRKKGRLKKNLKWTYRGETIDIVSSYKYLGINLTSTGKFGAHLESQLAVAKLGLNTVYKSVFFIQSRRIDAYFKLFDAVSRAVLCYAAQVWGYQKFDVVEKLLRFFIKKLLRLPYNTPNYMLMLETGRDPIFVFTLKLHWKFILKTLKGSHNRFSYILLQQGILKEHRWFKMLKSAALEFGNWGEFEGFEVEKVKPALDQVFDFLTQKERVGLLDQVMLGQLHPLYKELKTDWGRVNFFEDKLSIRDMRFVMMARMEMLPLNWKPWFPDDNHNCTLCNLKVIENVQHFLLECPVLREFRPDSLKNCDVIDILKGEIGWAALAKFISRSLNYRTFMVEEFNG